jgi:hypothetical protein
MNGEITCWLASPNLHMHGCYNIGLGGDVLIALHPLKLNFQSILELA